MEKICTKCKEFVSLDLFYKKSKSKDGLQSWCIPCTSENSSLWEKARKRPKRSERAVFAHWLKTKYKMSIIDWEKLFDSQKGVCAICFKKPNKRRLHVDHDHSCCPTNRTCGKCVRGLLCKSCNHALGNFSDNIDILQNAISYLTKNIHEK